MTRISVFCDESCHLENDGEPVMVLGAIWCEQEHVRDLSDKLAELKEFHSAKGELKWKKISRSREDFYDDVTQWFLTEDRINFRGIVVLDKTKLNHSTFNEGSHDLFYYKMYFSLLSKILSPTNKYKIYLDIKDTRSKKKASTLKDVLEKDKFDFTSQMISTLQNIRSNESQLMQLADFLIGAIAYKHRYMINKTDHQMSQTKKNIIDKIERSLNVDLGKSTPLSANKLNLFCFTPRTTPDVNNL